jgi:hypothetical protein
VALVLLLSVAIVVIVAELSAGTPSPPPEVSVPAQKTVTAASLSQVRALPSSVGHPVYWVGSRPGTRYEVTTTTDGQVFIRYLPPGAKVGSASAHALTVATYEVVDPVGALRAAARTRGAVVGALPGGAVSYYDPRRPTNVYVAFPSTYEQVEVYDPSPAAALRLARSGELRPVS